MEVGTVVQVIGPSVDIRFESEKLPKLFNAIKIEDPERKIDLTLEVAQHTGAPISVPVGEQTLGRIFNLLGNPIDEKGPVKDPKKRYSIHRPAPSFEDLLPVTEMFETGIKVIDLLAP